MALRISIELLGHLTVSSDGDQITRFRTQKTATLLAYLACHLHRSHPREELIELLWPDVEPEAGRTSLRTALASLRRQIEPPGAPENSILIADRMSVRLNPEAVETDTGRFEAAIRQAGRAPAAEKSEILTSGVEIYRGSLLPGLYDDWVLRERNRLEQLYSTALRDLIAALESLGQFEPAIQAGLRLVEVDPLAEETHLSLVRLYAASGQPAAAKRQAREWERIAREELADTPSSEFQAVLQSMQESGRSAKPPARSAVPRPAPRPEPAPQIQMPASQARALRLPLQLTRFFGRETEILEIEALLRSGGTRLLTLTGSGGTGKTRLALEVAARLAPEFDNVVYFAALAEIREAELLAGVLAKAVLPGLKVDSQPIEQIVENLAHRAVLLVLDNFEQLPYQAAETVQSLLVALPQLVCLVTSRSCLGIGGEQEYAVAPLPVPGATVTIEQITGFSSARLFADRARAVRPDFQITPANIEATAALCARLEGIPLAIELAAGWAQTQTPAQMLERLERRFDLLTSRRKDLAPRHRTLRATMEWSYRLLSPEQQQLFARLSVFRGGWTLEAAAAICDAGVIADSTMAETVGPPEASLIERMAELRERSLIATEETTEMFRFRLLDTLREYACEQLPESEHRLLMQRHLRVFLALAEEAERALSGPDQALWLDRVESEHENLQSALGYCQREGDAESGLRLASALSAFWHSRGYAREGLRWFAGFPEDQEGVSLPTRAKALASQAMLQRLLGDLGHVIELYEHSLRLYEQLSDRKSMASVLQKMHSPVYFHFRDYKRAVSLLERSLSLCREVGDLEGIANALASLGNLTRDQGEITLARSLYEQSLALYRRMGHTHGVSRVLADLAYMLTGQGEFSIAIEHLEEALSLSRVLNNRVSIGHILWLLGRVKEIQGDYAAARAYLEEGIIVARESGNQQQVFNCTANLGIVAELQQEYKTAFDRHVECLSVAHEMGDRWLTAVSRVEMGRMAFLLGDVAGAAALCRQSLPVLQETAISGRMIGCLETLAAGACMCGEAEIGIRLLGFMDAQREALGIPLSDHERSRLNRCIDRARRQLTESQFDAFWNAGRAESLDYAIALALTLDPFSFRLDS